MEVSVLAPASEECHRWGSPEAEAEMELQVQAFSSAQQRGRGAAGRGRGGAAMLARQSLGNNSGAGQTCYPASLRLWLRPTRGGRSSVAGPGPGLSDSWGLYADSTPRPMTRWSWLPRAHKTRC